MPLIVRDNISPRLSLEKWPQTRSLAGADGAGGWWGPVDDLSRPRISGNWPPTVVPV